MHPDERAAHQRRLELLRERAAKQGINTPPEVTLEIEDLTKKLETESIRPGEMANNSRIGALYRRTRFLDEINDTTDPQSLSTNAEELIGFIATLEMGAFYAKKVGDLIREPPYAFAISYIGRKPARNTMDSQQKRNQAYREQLRAARDEVYVLIDELIQFQKW